MIAKVPAKRSDSRSSFGSLGQYIAGDKLDRETGEVLRSADDVHLETNCLSVRTASAEMRAAAAANPRVKDPVYHCVLSWQEGEKPTDAQMIKAAKEAQNAVGMDGHQYVYAIHRDTGNAHVHMMINRVHPDTAKSVYPDRDFYKLDKCMRQVELAQGWAKDNGPYTVENGEVVKAERKVDREPPLPTKARDYESATGRESLISYAQSVKAEALAAVKKGSWQELHSALRKHGLEIKEAGQGFRIYSIDDPKQTPIKASDMSPDLGGGKLKKQLGEYEKPLRVVQSEKPERTYNKHRERDTAKRDERREARAEARRQLRGKYDQHRAATDAELAPIREQRKAAAKAAMKQISDEARAARAEIRARGYSAEDTKSLMSLAAMEAVQKRERLKTELKQERAAEKSKGFRDWVGQQAEKGDPAALAQLKGWQYDEQRKRSAAEKADAEAAERGAVRGDSYHDPIAPKPFTDGITWAVNRKTGDVLYQLDGKDALHDTGRQVSVLAQNDEKTIAAGLLLASQKFGRELTFTGSDEFKKRAVETAVRNGLGVTFADPELESYRSTLVAERGQGADRQGDKKQISAVQEQKHDADDWTRDNDRGGRGIGD